MLEIYQALLGMKCFTKDEVAYLIGDTTKAQNILYTLKCKGLVVWIKKNLYAAVSLETKQSVASPFEIASHITTDAYISHHSAFEYYGLANQVFTEIYVSSGTRFNSFDFDGYVYKRIESKCDEGIREEKKIRVTDLERTIIDGIKDFDKIGGLEELLRSLYLVTFAKAEKLLYYLQAYDNQFLYQKAGYILSHFPNLKLDDSFFTACQKKLNKSVRYLYADIKLEEPVLNKKWRLYVPNDLMHIIDEGGGEFV